MRLAFLALISLCLSAQQVDYRNVKNGPVVDVQRFRMALTSGNVSSGSLTTSGAKTLTIRPCPLGVNGADANHWLRISGGVGTAEDVLITGGTCTSGLSSGTLSFTTVNTHTGAWTISSSTGGIREGVLYLLGLGTGGELQLPFGNTTIYKGVVIEGAPSITISGCGVWCSTVIIDSSATSLTGFSCTASTCLVKFANFTIAGHSAHASGFGISISNNTAGRPKIQNVRAVDTAGGFNISNSDYVQILDSYYDQESNTGALYGILIQGTSSDIQIIGGRYAAPEINVSTMLDYALLIAGGDGITVTGAMFRGNIGIGIEPILGSGTTFLGSVFIGGGTIVDRCRTNAIRVLTTGAPTGSDFFGNLFFYDMHLTGDVAMEVNDIVSLNAASLGSGRAGISITNSFIANSRRHGIAAANINSFVIEGNTIVNHDTNNAGASAVYIVDGANIKIANNLIEDSNGTPKTDYGVNLGGAISYLNMTGNNIVNMATSPFNNGATVTNSVFGSNTGMDTLIPTMAAASTFTLPATNPKAMRLSAGTGSISIINTPVGNGDTRTFICDSGITFTSSASTWGVAQTLVATTANQVVTCTAYTGDSKWYCK